MSTSNTLDSTPEYKPIYFYSSLWLPVYTAFCILGSIPWLAITFPLGLTVADDVVFGALVVVGGPLGDFVFRKLFHRMMFLFGEIQALWSWPIIGIAVMILKPFEA